MKKSVILFLIFLFGFSFSLNFKVVKADSLNDEIFDQLENIDLSEIDDFANENADNFNLVEYVNKILSGNFDTDYSSIFFYLKNVFFNYIYKLIPLFSTLIAITLFSVLIKNLSGDRLSNGVSTTVNYVCVLLCAILIFSELLSIWTTTKNTISKIAKFNDVISPVLLTLMVASSGSVSAGVYRPVVAIFSNIITNVINVVIMPLICINIVFNILSNFTESVKFSRYSDFIAGLIKWIIGIIATVFGVFLSVQGLTSAFYDGISLKVAKYAINNSIPLVGGFLRDGLDVVICGSILIKNAIGLASIVVLGIILIIPVIKISLFSLTLKLSSAITESLNCKEISNMCFGLSKSITFLSATLLVLGFIFFIVILLMIFSASAIV